MRVAYIVPSIGSPSGWRTATIGIIRAMQIYAGVEPVLVVRSSDWDVAKKLFRDTEIIKLSETQKMAVSQPLSWLKLGATFWQITNKKLPVVDLVHSLDAYPTGLVGHWISNRYHKPHVLTALGTYAVRWHREFGDQKLYRTVLEQTDYICPMSNGTIEIMQKYYSSILATKKLQVVLLGTDYHNNVSRAEAVKYSAKPKVVLISVGAVKPRKGYHVSLAAFAQIKSVIPGAKYLIIGGIEHRSYFKRLQQFIKGHHLADVEFLGRISEAELNKRYQEASVFILTSQQIGDQFEGFGLVFLEAGAYGLPVVGTRVGGIPDAIKDNVTGFVVEPDDVNGIARAVLSLLQNPDLALKMGQANRNWCETLSWERFAREQFEIYRAVLQKTQ